MTRRRLIIAGIVLALSLNIFLVYQRFTNSPSVDGLDQAKESQKARSTELAQKDAAAAKLISEWNQGRVTALSTEGLLKVVERMPSGDCLTITTGGSPVHSANIPADQLADLHLAISGLLYAYRQNSPEAVIAYMRERGKQVDNDVLPLLKNPLLRHGETNLEDQTGEDLYLRLWKTLKSNTQWNGVVVDSSCRTVWDGKSLSLEHLLSFDDNEVTHPQSPEAVLMGIFRGSDSFRHNFAAISGSLENELQGNQPVFFADVLLIIELDQKQLHAKAAYLCRLWFNRAAQKWQPIALMGFASQPGSISLPSFLF